MVTREIWLRDDAGRPTRILTIVENEAKRTVRPWVIIAGMSIGSVGLLVFAFGKVLGL